MSSGDGSRPTPHDADVERRVLGLALKGGVHLQDILSAGLQVESFHVEGHRRIWAAIGRAQQSGEASLVGVSAQLEEAEGDPPLSKLAEIAEEGISAGPLAPLIHRLLDLQHRRKAIDLAQCAAVALSNGNPRAAEIVSDTARALESLSRSWGSQTSRFVSAAESAAALLAADIPAPSAILGDGLLIAGGLAFFVGAAGSGKTWAILDLGRSCARGRPWFGIPTQRCRVGILSLELPRHFMQQRLRAIGGEGLEGLEDIEIVSRECLPTAVDLTDHATMSALVAWCRQTELGLLIIDALSRTHHLNENDPQDASRLRTALDDLRYASGTALLVVHHEPKRTADSSNDSRRSHMEASRGHTVLTDGALAIMRLHEMRGALCLTFAKVNLGPTPEEIWLRPTDLGPLILRDEPPTAEEIGDRNLAAVRTIVLESQDDIGVDAIIDHLRTKRRISLQRRTIYKHLSTLTEAGEIAKTGRGSWGPP